VELIESTEILKLILSGTNAGIWSWDLKTGEVYWSDNFYELLCYKPGGIPATAETFFDRLVHPDDLEMVNNALSNHFEYRQPYKIEVRLKTKDSVYRYFECNGKALFLDDKPVMMAGCIADIHDRKMLENKVAESEFLLSEAGRVARVGGWEFDFETGRSTWSKTVYDIYELTNDYDIDADNPYRWFLPPYDELLKNAVEESIAKGVIWDLEMQMVTVKKSVIWVRSYGEPVRGANGEMQKLRGVFMDIEKYKSNEIALSHSIELIRQSNLQLKNFTHILSHNIRNHANNIAQLTLLIDTDNLDYENADLFQKIERVSHNLTATLEDLSEAVRIQESELVADTLEFDEVINGVLEILDSDLKNNQVTIIKELLAESVKFPRIYLDSVIMNLLTNAIKYRKPDVPPVITLKTYIDQNNAVVLECSDNGIGIDLQMHGKKIFGLYKTFNDRKDAHGVGLFLIKTQVESQGGQIFVDSEPNVGTTFKIVFRAKN
jgi:PAS domain S-box-containing protein